MEPGQAQETLDRFLQQIIRNGGFDLEYTIEAQEASAEAPAGETGAATACAFAVNFSGQDVPLLVARNGELLHAVESIAAELLGLAPGEHHLLSFDAEGYRAERARSLEQAVEQACEGVKRSGRPHAFPPMNSRERRLIHLAAARHGISTASSGEGPRRSVVLYPAGMQPSSTAPQGAGGGSLSPSLPGERRSHIPFVPDDIGNRAASAPGWGDRRGSRPGFAGPRRGGGRFGGPGARGGSMGAPPFDPQRAGNVAEDDASGDQPSAEDRARAIRERFRKR